VPAAITEPVGADRSMPASIAIRRKTWAEPVGLPAT
jgi:hypothetical protein